MSDVIFYVPPVTFSIVSLAFLLLWYLNITAAWQWSAGFAQTALGFVVSTFVAEPSVATFGSGMIFIGAAYCYGSGLIVHFGMPKLRLQRLSFVAIYSVALTYFVFVDKSLVRQLFLTDIGFAILFGAAVVSVARKASRPIDIALVVSTSIVVLDSVVRAVFFTFFHEMSDNLSDFANSLYNIQVSITTITVCMFFPFIALGASAFAAIERHRTVADKDELTGLLNRRGFQNALASDVKARRGAVIVCDIDYFKRINDTYGHAMGDRVIKILAHEIESLVGKHGRAMRSGGEEFAAILPDASLEEGIALAELLRVSFANKEWDKEGLSHQVTISCGVSLVRSGETTLDYAINRADSALYAAKSAGRNQVLADEASTAMPKTPACFPTLVAS